MNSKDERGHRRRRGRLPLRQRIATLPAVAGLFLLFNRMTVSAGATGGNTSSNPGIESIVACTFLFCVVLMQVLAGFSKAVRLGAGRVGRVVYHLAFAITVVHDFFIALAVPASLLWVAVKFRGCIFRTRANGRAMNKSGGASS